MIVEPFRPYHIDLLRAQGVQAAQLGEISLVPLSCANLPAPPGPAVTVFDGERVIVCGGIAVKGPGRGECWALMGEGVGRHMHWLHFAVKRFITAQRWQRLEAAVEEGFGPGCRWVELLGFSYEGKMPGYGLCGETYLRYARVCL